MKNCKCIPPQNHTVADILSYVFFWGFQSMKQNVGVPLPLLYRSRISEWFPVGSWQSRLKYGTARIEPVFGNITWTAGQSLYRSIATCKSGKKEVRYCDLVLSNNFFPAVSTNNLYRFSFLFRHSMLYLKFYYFLRNYFTSPFHFYHFLFWETLRSYTFTILHFVKLSYFIRAQIRFLGKQISYIKSNWALRFSRLE
jgi:hypothetical protein